MNSSFEEIQDMVFNAHMGIINEILNNSEVRTVAHKALAAGVNWISIIAAVLPFVMQIVSGGTVNWQAIIAAITALIPASGALGK